MATTYFKNRQLVIATMHGKEKVIAPLLQQLGVEIILPQNLNTDSLGTFTGEIERINDPLETAKQKCMQAMQATGCTLAIANEGSFGPHPQYYFLPADEEILVLLDTENNLEIKTSFISTETNFAAKACFNKQEVNDFAKQVLFPSHALIVKPSETTFTPIHKGITSEEDLKKYCTKILQSHSQVFVQTDMRAMHNPSRMKVIEQATQQLLTIINSLCPNCQAPGFTVTKTIKGLPCSFCGTPSNYTLYHIYTCNKCSYMEEKKFPNGKESINPMYCQICNP